MDLTLEYIGKKIDLKQKSPIEIQGMNREDLAKMFNDLEFRVGVEVGVEKGEYSRVLCEHNPQLKLYSVDPWRAYKAYRDHISQSKLDRFYEESKRLLAPYNNCQIMREFSVEAAKKFSKGSLDFVYIDGNHEFQQVTNDIAVWSKKVRKGGIVAGHDFRRSKGSYPLHVKDVVLAWTRSHKITPWFVLRGDKSPSWFWIN